MSRLADTKGLRTWPSWWPTRAGAPRPRPGRPDRGVAPAGAVGRRDLGDAGPLLDGRARSEYRRRVEQLRSEIDDAFAADQLDRAEAAQAELDVLVLQLAQAFGFGGRDRRAASAAERARLNVTRALRAATARLDEALPGAGRALDRRLRTGLYCAYEPAADDTIRWIVQSDRTDRPAPNAEGHGQHARHRGRSTTDLPDLDLRTRREPEVHLQPVPDRAEEPLPSTPARGAFPLVAEAVASVLPVESLRWISFGHVESDECGAMNMWLAAAPDGQVAHGALGCMVSLNDLCHRPPRPLEDGEVIDLGSKRLRQISTPHVPHGWEAQVLFEETTGTLLCGDSSHVGHPAPLTEADVVEPASSPRRCSTPPAWRPTPRPPWMLGDLRLTTLAIMHGSSFRRRPPGAVRPGRRLRAPDLAA
jgi:hypothetical protein